ncbi:MAG: hypothetical protein KO464_01610 [Candidatus Methanofastidiosum sp.]|nr:hypothetical protein [Methanofastidiosum sp.]
MENVEKTDKNINKKENSKRNEDKENGDNMVRKKAISRPFRSSLDIAPVLIAFVAGAMFLTGFLFSIVYISKGISSIIEFLSSFGMVILAIALLGIAILSFIRR